MKKKILLMFVVSLVVCCLFALGVSASEFESGFTTEVTTYEGEPEWADLDDRDATAVLKTSSGEYIRIPLYYIYQEKNTTFTGDIRDESNQTSSGFRYAWISEQLGETVNHSNLVALEIPYGTLTINGQFGGVNTIYSALEELVIPSTVTSLNEKFLRDNPIIKRVFIKQTRDNDGNVQGVTSIPHYFADITVSNNSSSLEYFALELDYVTYVGSNAFMKSKIKSITLEGPITSINSTAFSNCTSLETVNINNTGDTIMIGGKAFAYSTALKSVTLNGFSLSDYLFESVNGTSGGLTVIATNVKTTGTMPFKNATNLSLVEISGPITSIGGSTFLGCTNLATVKITNTLETPASCGSNTFDGLKNLASVTLHGISIGSCAFRNTNGPSDMIVTATNVGAIGDQAFFNAENTVEIYVSGPFTSINTGSTFRDCGKLKKLTIINTGDNYVPSGNGEINPALTDLIIKGKINVGSPAFQNNASLKNIHLGDGVNQIGDRAFYKCYGMEKVYLADSITVIGDRAFDMEAVGNQTSESFMFVDENGNMDNYLPTSLTTINGHFLKRIKIANTEIIFPEGFTRHTSSQVYDFEGTIYPEGFRLIYLGKMEIINLACFYTHNAPHNVTVYLTKNSASDIKNERIYADVTTTEAGTTIAHGKYAGVNESGTLEIVINDSLQNNIKATEYIKFYFCGSDEVCFVTRVNIEWGPDNAKNWGNFVSTPVTYEQLSAAYETYNASKEDAEKVVLPAKHPMLSAPEYSEATCTEPSGTKTYCLGCGQIATVEKDGEALGHNYDLNNGATDLGVAYGDYFQIGTHKIGCARCDVIGEEEVEALFIDKGYSACQFDTTLSITRGYKVNKTAITDYMAYSTDLKVGVVIAVNQGTEEFVPDFESEKVLSSTINATANDYIDIKIIGIPADKKETLIVLSVYVKEGDKTYFLENGTTTETVVGVNFENAPKS